MKQQITLVVWLALVIGILGQFALAAKTPAPAPKPAVKPVVVIEAYYPLNERHQYIKDYLEKFAKSKGDKVKFTFYDQNTEAGMQASMKTNLNCAGVLINGKSTWNVRRGKKTEEVSFTKRMDIQWERKDFEWVVNDLLAKAAKSSTTPSKKK
jgi:hypothetical protein